MSAINKIGIVSFKPPKRIIFDLFYKFCHGSLDILEYSVVGFIPNYPHTQKLHKRTSFARHSNRVSKLKIIKYRLNSSFSLLTFPKLRFWPTKKKTTKSPPKFCICGIFGPQCQFWLGLRWRGTLREVARVIFFTKNWPWEAKTATVAKLRGAVL